MATKILKDMKVNGIRVFFGVVNSKYLICLPDYQVSGYLDPFTEEFQQDNTQKLSNLLKSKGIRGIAFSYLVIHTINEMMKGEVKENE